MADFTLQILHGSDFEAGLFAVDRAKNFAAIVDKLEDSTPNSITLSGGDNFIPGPFIAAGTDPTILPALKQAYADILHVPVSALASLSLAAARSDIAILNAIGIQASVIGNHDFDLGPQALNDAVDFIGTTTANISSIGAQFPYLSANLDFSGDPALSQLYTATLREASSYATTAADLANNAAVAAEGADKQIAPWTVITVNGERIGIVAATTQLEASLTTLGNVKVLDPAGDGGVDNTTELATIIQGYVDQLTAMGINKIVTLTHLQQYQLEEQLAPKLHDVDVMIAGGSHQIFAGPDDVLRPGDTPAQGYPVIEHGTDGAPVAIISTGNEYSYVGQLTLTFDDAGHIVVNAIDPTRNGPIATTDANVQALWGNLTDPFAAGTRGAIVKELTDPIGAVIGLKDGNVFGFSDVYLNGLRNSVRTEETNLGDLTADAFIYAGKQVDASVKIALHNGGGIRAEIGSYSTGATATPLPPAANPAAGKAAGGVSQLDIENSLRFNNNLALVTVTAQNLERLLEFNAALVVPGTTPGGYDQYGGLAYSFDTTKTAQVLSTVDGSVTTVGNRVINAAVLNDDGTVADLLVQDGNLVGDPTRSFRLATFDFIANGGDNNPLKFYGTNLTLLLNNSTLAANGTALGVTGPAPGSEQWALAAYLKARYDDPNFAFFQPDTAQSGDARLENLAVQADSVRQATQTAPGGGGTLTGTEGSDLLIGGVGNDRFVATGSRDTVIGNGGDDLLDFGLIGRGHGGLVKEIAGNIDEFGFVSKAGNWSTTHWTGVETVHFADGDVQLGATANGVRIDLLYRGLLERAGDAEGVARFAKFQENGGTEAQTATMIAASAEAQSATGGLSDTAYVQHLYDAVLGRAPDAGGLTGWVNALNGHTLTRAQVATGFADSAEAAGDPLHVAANGVIVGDLDILQVGHLYQAVLGRAPDQGGLQVWDANLNAGATEASLVRAFAASPEFHARFDGLTNGQFIEAVYENQLGRDPDPAGQMAWLNGLNNGLSRADMEVMVYASVEAHGVFQHIVQHGIDLI